MIDPWLNISASAHSGEVTLRRADPSHPMEFFRGRNSAGRYLFILQVRAPLAVHDVPPIFAGVEVSLRPLVSGGAELVLTLNNADELDVFRALCGDLMEATRGIRHDDDGAAVTIVIARLVRWQQMLKQLRDRRLDQAKILGLFGELLLLRDFFLTKMPASDALRAWRGPYSDQQDFLMNGWVIEVKTQLSTSDSKVTISSTDQLDYPSERLLLCHQTVDVVQAGQARGGTLNSVVREIARPLRLNDIAAYDLFLSGLVAAGYAEHAEYEEATWGLGQRSWFHVREGFPRLVASDVPAGVENVRYSIRLEKCNTFRVEDSQAARWICNGTNER